MWLSLLVGCSSTQPLHNGRGTNFPETFYPRRALRIWMQKGKNRFCHLRIGESSPIMSRSQPNLEYAMPLRCSLLALVLALPASAQGPLVPYDQPLVVKE